MLRLPRVRQQVAQLHDFVTIDDNVGIEIGRLDLVDEFAATTAWRQDGSVVVDGDEGAHPRLVILEHVGHRGMLGAKPDAATQVDRAPGIYGARCGKHGCADQSRVAVIRRAEQDGHFRRARYQVFVSHDPLPFVAYAGLLFHESTYARFSTPSGNAATVNGNRASIITAYSSVSFFACAAPAANAFGCGACVNPHGWKVTIPGLMLSRLKKSPRW